jgi:hypothetical protein
MLSQFLRQIFTAEINLTICHIPAYKGNVGGGGGYELTSIQTQYINYPRRDLLSGITKLWLIHICHHTGMTVA